MPSRLVFAVVLLALGLPLQAQEPGQSGSSTAAATAGHGAGHGRRGRGPKRFMLANGEGAVIRLWRPDLSSVILRPEHGSVTLSPTGMEGLHALVVQRDWGDGEETLLRYLDLRGKPTGHSPRDLLAVAKSRFEIVPDPQPREHRRYRSGEEWGFLLRFDNRPVAGVAVTLTTAQGTRLDAVSAADGSVEFTLPDDFPRLVEGVKDDRSAGFQVSAVYRHQQLEYRTSLDADYRVDPRHWRSSGWGVAVASLGLVAGGLVGRRIRRREGVQ